MPTSERSGLFLLLAVFFFALAGCLDDPPLFLVDVEVMSGTAGEPGQALADARVQLRHSGEESALAHGELIDEARGIQRARYRFAKKKDAPDHLLLVIEADGHAPRQVRVPPVSPTLRRPLLVRATLYPTEEFEVKNLFRLAMTDHRVSVTLPSEKAETGRVRLFHPVTDSAGMPGPLVDSLGRHLDAAVFASVNLDDGAGRRVSEAGESTVLRMRLPKSMWPAIAAIEPGDTFIEPGDTFIEPGDTFIEPGDTFTPSGDIRVPVFGFDTGAGAWSFSAVGWLESSPGEAVRMDELNDIWDLEYGGSLFVCAQVPHFSFWGLAWPLAGDACLTGEILDETGRPAEGVTVTARGIDRPVSVQPAVTDHAGVFCLTVPPLAGDAPYRLRVEASYATEDADEGMKLASLDLGEVTVTADAMEGTCLEGQCQKIELDGVPEWVVDEIQRFITDPGGRDCEEDGCLPGMAPEPPEDLDLCELSIDIENVPHEARITWSHRLPTAPTHIVRACESYCRIYEDPEGDGYVMKAPAGERVEMTGTIQLEHQSSWSIYSGSAQAIACPAEPVTVAFSKVLTDVLLPVSVDIESRTIFWGELPAYFVEVRSASDDPSMPGELKWAIGAEGRAQPRGSVLYGDPGGAMQLHPPPVDEGGDTQKPPPLQRGDVVKVHASFVNAVGEVVTAEGSATVQ